MRYRFRCEYLGSAFYGWQAQNEGGKTKFVTVQSALEEAFSIVLRSPIRITGSGRTDTGVHARGQCVHFDFDGELDPGKVERSINGLTKRLIRIHALLIFIPVTTPFAATTSIRFSLVRWHCCGTLAGNVVR